MPDLPKAVFLSYASQDADAAKRICDALRAAGVEVWFDQSELVGGDAWDAKIRGQIASCALFVPVVSAHTQARLEGYFRLEWKLAAQRTHTMADEKAFLLPVVVDDTRDAEAKVPAEFKAVQWTKLPGGETPGKFCIRVKRLLEGETEDGGQRTENRIRNPEPETQNWRPGRLWWALPIFGVTMALILVLKEKREVPPPATAASTAVRSESGKPTVGGAARSETTNPGPASLPSADAKSVAILPFTNLSAEPANAFFADGMHEEVLTTVAKIAALKVIARTSVLPYADASRRNLRQIAAELGVETVLEGSVRRMDNRVRIAVQLVEVRTSRQLWSETYERPLDDVFGVQVAIAEEIAAHLSAALTPGERDRLQWRPAPTPEAYQLYLRARVDFGEIGTPSLAPREKIDAAIALFERAAAADPQFALPLVQLAQLHGYLYWFGTFDPTPARAQRAIAVVQKLQELAPDAPETHLAVGAVLNYQCRNDWEQALAELRLAQPGLPNDSQLYQWQGFALRRLGRWQPACESFENVLLREPNNVFTAESLVETTRFTRRYAEAARRAAEFLRRFPQSAALRSDGAAARFALDGNPAAYLAALLEKPSDAAYQRRHVWDALLYTGRYEEAERHLTAGGRTQLSSLGAVVNDPVTLYQAQLAFLRGEPAEAARLAAEARAYYEAGTWNARQEPFVNAGLAMAAALAGDTAAVERHARRARELLQVRADAFNASFLPAILGPAYAAAGRPELALDELRRLVTEAGDISPAAVRSDPFWLRLKGDTRFEEILQLATEGGTGRVALGGSGR